MYWKKRGLITKPRRSTVFRQKEKLTIVAYLRSIFFTENTDKLQVSPNVAAPISQKTENHLELPDNSLESEKIIAETDSKIIPTDDKRPDHTISANECKTPQLKFVDTPLPKDADLLSGSDDPKLSSTRSFSRDISMIQGNNVVKMASITVHKGRPDGRTDMVQYCPEDDLWISEMDFEGLQSPDYSREYDLRPRTDIDYSLY